MFRVGQKVVCVDASGLRGFSPISKGAIYTIRSIESDVQRPHLGVGLYFAEIKNARHANGCEYGYYSNRFRPAVERKTSIAVFEAMLKKVPATAEPRQTHIPAERAS